MACIIRQAEKPELEDPVLLEGLPGIGLVANIAVAYLIRKLGAKFFAEVKSASFPDVSVTDKGGSLKSPFCHMYYHKADDKCSRDLILLYGNTQALTRRGQYELCGSILDTAKSLRLPLRHHFRRLQTGTKSERANTLFRSLRH